MHAAHAGDPLMGSLTPVTKNAAKRNINSFLPYSTTNKVVPGPIGEVGVSNHNVPITFSNI